MARVLGAGSTGYPTRVVLSDAGPFRPAGWPPNTLLVGRDDDDPLGADRGEQRTRGFSLGLRQHVLARNRGVVDSFPPPGIAPPGNRLR